MPTHENDDIDGGRARRLRSVRRAKAGIAAAAIIATAVFGGLAAMSSGQGGDASADTGSGTDEVAAPDDSAYDDDGYDDGAYDDDAYDDDAYDDGAYDDDDADTSTSPSAAEAPAATDEAPVAASGGS